MTYLLAGFEASRAPRSTKAEGAHEPPSEDPQTLEPRSVINR